MIYLGRFHSQRACAYIFPTLIKVCMSSNDQMPFSDLIFCLGGPQSWSHLNPASAYLSSLDSTSRYFQEPPVMSSAFIVMPQFVEGLHSFDFSMMEHVVRHVMFCLNRSILASDVLTELT